MNIKKTLLLVLSFFLIGILFHKTAEAIDLKETLTSGNSIFVKIQEGVQYFFAFKVENKIHVLEKHAEKRLVMAQEYAEDGNNEKVQNLIQNYLQIKEKQNNLLGKVDGELLNSVTEKIIEQQKTMEEIKLKVDGETKQNVVQVQEQVVNQIAKNIIEVNGPEGATGFLNEVVHVWAPGTGPGGEAGVVVVGGELKYAPGTSAGGEGGVVVVGGQMMFAPGASAGGSGGTSVQNVVVGGEGGGGNVSTPGGQGETGATNIIEGGVGGDTGSTGSTGDGAPGVIDPATNFVAP
jgi:hypothetical protein